MSTNEITGNAQSFINIPDCDAPVYRIFSLWGLEESLRTGRNTLVRPEKWDDPYEFGIGAFAVNRVRDDGVEQIIITNGLPPSFAQCWSATGESDTLLRAYSRVVKHPIFSRNTTPGDEGVRVRSTPRKLLTALQAAAATELPAGTCYIGAVRYLPGEKLLGEVATVVQRFKSVDIFSEPRNRAERLLMKREPFAHEAEVRLLYLPHKAESFGDTVSVRMNFTDVFDEITFDSRLDGRDRAEREATVVRLGYKGIIGKSDLYQRVDAYTILDERTTRSE